VRLLVVSVKALLNKGLFFCLEVGMKYLRDGQGVEVIQKLESGEFLVVNIYLGYNGDGDEEYVDHSTPYVVKEVFESAPVLKYLDQVDALLTEIETLQKKRAEMARDINSCKREHEERKKDLTKYAGAELLFDFIDGKISHYVTIGYSGAKIVEFTDEMKTDGSCDREKLKLLSLFGRSNGDLTWNLNRYSDGSGSNSEVIPCTSLDMANAEAKRYVLERIDKTSGKPESRVIASAEKFGVEVPKEYREAVIIMELETAEKNVTAAKDKLGQYEQILADKKKQ
jgi:hypothetical protein